jgi:hypothetical protein
MRTPRDVFNYLKALEAAQELEDAHNSESKIDQCNDVPSNISSEREQYLAGEKEYSELSLDLKMWLALESVQAKRKDPIFYSDLPNLLEQETWRPKDAMLILAGVDPEAAIMEWSYENFMGAEIQTPVIRHANWFTSKSDLYDYPIAEDSEFSSSELKGMIREAKSGTLSPNDAEQRLRDLEVRLKETERWEQNKTSSFKSSMLSLRARMVGILKNRWENGDHDNEQRRSPTFFVQWAESRGFDVEWSAWARENDFIDAPPPITAPPFFDADSEDYPKLLHIAVRSWEHARQENHGTAKKRILEFLNDRYPELSTSEKEAIALIGNWQKSGGRPKTGG